MTQHPKICVAGCHGMRNAVIVCHLLAQYHLAEQIATRAHDELDMTDQAAVHTSFVTQKTNQVYRAPAKMDRIHASNTYPAEFIYQKLVMGANNFDVASRNGVEKLFFLGSSCICPYLAVQPMRA